MASGSFIYDLRHLQFYRPKDWMFFRQTLAELFAKEHLSNQDYEDLVIGKGAILEKLAWRKFVLFVLWPFKWAELGLSLIYNGLDQLALLGTKKNDIWRDGYSLKRAWLRGLLTFIPGMLLSFIKPLSSPVNNIIRPLFWYARLHPIKFTALLLLSIGVFAVLLTGTLMTSGALAPIGVGLGIAAVKIAMVTSIPVLACDILIKTAAIAAVPLAAFWGIKTYLGLANAERLKTKPTLDYTLPGKSRAQVTGKETQASQLMFNTYAANWHLAITNGLREFVPARPQATKPVMEKYRTGGREIETVDKTRPVADDSIWKMCSSLFFGGGHVYEGDKVGQDEV